MIKPLCVFCFLPSVALANSVLVFTDENHPIVDPYHQATVCQIIDTKALNAQINDDIQRMRFTNKEAIANYFAKDFKRIEASHVCLNQAHVLGVTKLPTIVIGGRHIVGLESVPDALNLYAEKSHE